MTSDEHSDETKPCPYCAETIKAAALTVVLALAVTMLAAPSAWGAATSTRTLSADLGAWPIIFLALWPNFVIQGILKYQHSERYRVRAAARERNRSLAPCMSIGDAAAMLSVLLNMGLQILVIYVVIHFIVKYW